MGQFSGSIGIGDGDSGGALSSRCEMSGASVVMRRVGLTGDGSEGELLLPMRSDGTAIRRRMRRS